ncbi:oligosaccharide flippase family protein [Vibrio algivorus]|uniref:oligosaccharide flippase family protein n=1 Tax=Vibrio algivorus TaxID=1667024 RepID=UPI001642EF05|nr:oligosaccharide flippase family protein [Vibrio algivorus]
MQYYLSCFDLNVPKSLLHNFLGTAGLQLVGKGLTVIAGIVFARALGPEEFGRYSFVLSIITVAMLPVIAGLPYLIVREVSRYFSDLEYSKLCGFVRWSAWYVLGSSLLSVTVLATLICFDFWEPSLQYLLIPAFLLLPLRGMLVRQSAVINGFQRSEIAQIPLAILLPVFVLLMLLGGYLLNAELTARLLIYMQVFSALITFIASFILMSYVIRKAQVDMKETSYSIHYWHKSLLPFTIIAIIGTMNSELGTLVLGFYADDASIGFFKVAVQGITLLAIGLQAVNTVSGPKIASLYKQGRLKDVQSLLNQSVKFSALTSIPFAFLLVVFGKTLIVFLFGESYLPAASLLVMTPT